MNGLNQNSGPSLELVRTLLDNIRDQAMMDNTTVGKAEATDPVIFTQSTADKAAVNTAVIGGGQGYFVKSTDDLAKRNSVSIKASAGKLTLIAEFDKTLEISRTFMQDQQHDAVTKAVNQQTKTWLATRDQNAFLVYANGFTTQTTVDGVALFSNSHVNENGNTVDNLETGALNDSNLNIGVNSLRTQVSQTGVALGYEPKFLLTPSILHQTGMAVTKSVLRAGTGNNDLNYWSEMYPGMQVKFSQFLDPVSTTAWFIGTSYNGVTRFTREGFFTQLVPWQYQQNNAYVYKMIAREEVDSIEYSGLLGSTGAA